MFSQGGVRLGWRSSLGYISRYLPVNPRFALTKYVGRNMFQSPVLPTYCIVFAQYTNIHWSKFCLTCFGHKNLHTVGYNVKTHVSWNIFRQCEREYPTEQWACRLGWGCTLFLCLCVGNQFLLSREWWVWLRWGFLLCVADFQRWFLGRCNDVTPIWIQFYVVDY